MEEALTNRTVHQQRPNRLEGSHVSATYRGHGGHCSSYHGIRLGELSQPRTGVATTTHGPQHTNVHRQHWYSRADTIKTHSGHSQHNWQC
jgi:hypothetical protein